MQLISNPVHFDLSVFVKGTLWRHNLDLQSDLLTELVSVRTSEAKDELVDLVGWERSLEDCDWDTDLEVFLALNFEVDGDVDEVDRHVLEVYGLVHSEETSLFPGPVS